MAIGSIINLGGSGGSLSGKGLIIVDTSSMVIGDKVRVRSVYDSLITEDKTVATVGVPLYFQVEPYDYYKVCMVQTISDVETEIGGAYTTIDVGQTVYVNVLDKTTLGGIQGILNSHTENYALNIGDEVTIKINDGTPKDWVMQIAEIDSTNHSVILISKNLWKTEQWGTATNQYYSSYLKSKVEAFYSIIDERDKQYIKTTRKATFICGSSAFWQQTDCNVWIPNKKEIDGSLPTNAGTPPITQNQFAIFTTQANRVKTLNGNAYAWWTCDGAVYSGSTNAWAINSSGNAQQLGLGQPTIATILPCFTLTADL